MPALEYVTIFAIEGTWPRLPNQLKSRQTGMQSSSYQVHDTNYVYSEFEVAAYSNMIAHHIFRRVWHANRQINHRSCWTLPLSIQADSEPPPPPSLDAKFRNIASMMVFVLENPPHQWTLSAQKELGLNLEAATSL